MRALFAVCLLILTACSFGQVSPGAIKPGDRIKIICEQEASLSKDYVVTKDGVVVLPFLGAVMVAGWTPEEAAARIRDRLLDERILTEATVTVTFATQTNRPVTYRGAVKFPGEAPWRLGISLQDILAIAKPTEVADLERIEITPVNGEKITVNAALVDSSPTTLRPGDALYVPVRAKSEEVFVLGGVVKPGVVEWSKPVTVRTALQLAGGLNGQGDPEGITLRRGKQPPRNVAASSGEPLEPGDTLVVALLPERRWIMVDGAVKKPGPVDFREGITLSAAIHEVGGILPLIPLDRAELKRTVNGKDQITKLNIDQILRGLGGDPKLQPGDRITIVPKKRRK
ncbi:MAG: hypothetical protein HONBIEJF_00597 [Fimbriimonadaceae bacterium]|nr:hypothetical protein [Fimbriimonadaceae bacterium]